MIRARHLAWVVSAGLHAAAGAALLHGMPQPAEELTPVMLLEMSAPEMVAPEPIAEPVTEPVPEPMAAAPAPPEPEPPPPEPMAPEPSPPPVAEVTPSVPEPEPPPPAEVAELPVPPPPPPPKPVVRQPVAPRRHAPPPRTPTVAEAAPPATAPAAPAAAPTPAAVAAAPSPNYAAALMRALERHRRYPEEARWRRAQGVALLRFRMRRDGTVISYRVERSAGDPALDQAVQTMIQNASPLPAPPDDLAGDPIELTVPVRFSLR